MLSAGFAEVDITPPSGLRLGGYMHRLGLPSKGFKDPLYARILVLSSERESFAIVQLDLLGVYRSFTNELRSAIRKALGVENIMVATTHTHLAPETVIPMWPNTLPYSDEERKLLEFWMKSVVEKVRRVAEGLRLEPVNNVCIGYASVEGLCYNRAFPGELFDYHAPFVMIGGSRRIVIYSSPCHPVCNTDLYYSADYHAHVVKALKSSGIDSVPLTAPAGDVDPVRKGYDYAIYMGSEIGKRIIESISSCKSLDPVISSASTEIEVPLRSVNYENALKRFREVYAKYIDLFMTERAKGAVDERYFSMFEELLYADQELEVAKRYREKLITEVQILRIGNAFLVGFPGEMVSDTSIIIKKTLPNMHIIFSTYTNDYIGYVPTKRFFDNGRYEARTALWSIVSQDSEQIIRGRIVDMILLNLAREAL
jgi:hypothetical protein